MEKLVGTNALNVEWFLLWKKREIKVFFNNFEMDLFIILVYFSEIVNDSIKIVPKPLQIER
jgi:predicted small integral membrane protein